ncbi:transcriptional regulator [Chelativorans xinjiangense]|uniref:HVO_A0114 family putative DNA-binding protein n=1 Tax=Chelativorans xinjiangense TaxID=2681485 RepID=UPI001356AEC3|nr:transcriptional regulator [Chelativorans xinjiangense]
MKRAAIRIRHGMDIDAEMEEMGKRFVETWHSGKPADPLLTLTFSSPAQLFSVITPKRWELIERLQGIGPSSIRGLARALERDVKRVHEDVTTLIEWGLVERTEDGKVEVPFEVIHADFDLRALA